MISGISIIVAMLIIILIAIFIIIMIVLIKVEPVWARGLLDSPPALGKRQVHLRNQLLHQNDKMCIFIRLHNFDEKKFIIMIVKCHRCQILIIMISAS